MEYINKLKKAYKNLPWYSRWFFPAKLAENLNNSDSTFASICESFESDVWFFHKWFYFFLAEFNSSNEFKLWRFFGSLRSLEATWQDTIDKLITHAHLDDVTQSLCILNEVGLLNKDNANMIIGHANPRAVVEAVQILKISTLLANDSRQANFLATIVSDAPSSIAQLLSIFNEINLLTENNRNAISRFQTPEFIASKLIELKAQNSSRHVNSRPLREIRQEPSPIIKLLLMLSEVNLLNEDTLNLLLDRQNFHGIVDALIILKDVGLLMGEHAQANVELLIANESVEDIIKSLNIISKFKLLSNGNVRAIINHKNASFVVSALLILQKLRFFTGDDRQVNLELVIKHESLNSIVQLLQILDESKLLNISSIKSILKRQNVTFIANIIVIFKKTGLLTKDNYNIVFACKHLESVAKIFDIMESLGLLNTIHGEVNFVVIMNHANPDLIANSLIYLKEAGLLNADNGQSNFMTLLHHKYPQSVLTALTILNLEGILTAVNSGQDNYNVVMKKLNGEFFCNDAEFVAKMLVILQSADLLTENNRNCVAKRVAFELYDSLIILQSADLLTQENFSAIIKSNETLGCIARGLNKLYLAGFLMQINHGKENVSTFLSHSDPLSFAEALITLKEIGLLTEINRNALIQCQSPSSVRLSLLIIQEAGLLTQDNFTAIVTSRHSYQLFHYQMYCALKVLKSANLLDGEQGQYNFYATVVTYADILLCCDHLGIAFAGWANIWEKIPKKYLTTERLQYIFAIAAKDEESSSQRRISVRQYVSDLRLLFIQEEASQQLPIIVIDEVYDFIRKLSSNKEELQPLLEQVRNNNFSWLWSSILSAVTTKVRDMYRGSLSDEFSAIYPEGKESIKFAEFIAGGRNALNSRELIELITKMQQTKFTSQQLLFFSATEFAKKYCFVERSPVLDIQKPYLTATQQT